MDQLAKSVSNTRASEGENDISEILENLEGRSLRMKTTFKLMITLQWKMNLMRIDCPVQLRNLSI
jgi:hypothetical protein